MRLLTVSSYGVRIKNNNNNNNKAHSLAFQPNISILGSPDFKVSIVLRKTIYFLAALGRKSDNLTVFPKLSRLVMEDKP